MKKKKNYFKPVVRLNAGPVLTHENRRKKRERRRLKKLLREGKFEEI